MKNALAERVFSIGLWAWLQIVEKDAHRLSREGQIALKLLREDLERMADEDGQTPSTQRKGK